VARHFAKTVLCRFPPAQGPHRLFDRSGDDPQLPDPFIRAASRSSASHIRLGRIHSDGQEEAGKRGQAAAEDVGQHVDAGDALST
jgi:hypothetical protein